MLHRAVFKNADYEKTINQQGFVAVPGFLNPEKIKLLYDLYKKHHQSIDDQKGMWNSLYNLTAVQAREISQEILSLLTPDLASLFEKYSSPVASFMSKNPGEQGICELHRDFSIMDETKFEYRNVWIPLVDITLTNGALYALAGSHLVFNYPLPMFCKWPYTHLQKELLGQATVFTVKAGDLVVYADRTLHGSQLNLSSESRPVVHLGVLSTDFETAYYHLNQDTVYVYAVPYEFYFQNQFGDLAGRYPLIKTFAYQPPAVDSSVFLRT